MCGKPACPAKASKSPDLIDMGRLMDSLDDQLTTIQTDHPAPWSAKEKATAGKSGRHPHHQNQ
jgi:hypothetical protein